MNDLEDINRMFECIYIMAEALKNDDPKAALKPLTELTRILRRIGDFQLRLEKERLRESPAVRARRGSN